MVMIIYQEVRESFEVVLVGALHLIEGVDINLMMMLMLMLLLLLMMMTILMPRII